jgi:arylformamidase
MKIYDLSLTISPELPVWPGDPSVQMSLLSSMEQGAHVNITQVTMCVHTGTHVDAPRHFLRDGGTIEKLLLEALVGPAVVVHIPDEINLITAEVLEKANIPQGTERVLFKTRNSGIWQRGEKQFQTNFVAVPVDGAEWLVQRGVKLVGIDYLSVSPYKISIPTHHALLKAGVVILEGVNLAEVEAGEYELYCLPLKLAGSDGAPARAVLVSR